MKGQVLHLRAHLRAERANRFRHTETPLKRSVIQSVRVIFVAELRARRRHVR